MPTIAPETLKVETSMREKETETGTRITNSEMETDTETRIETEMKIGIEIKTETETKTGTVIRTGTEIKTDTEMRKDTETRKGTEMEANGIDLLLVLSLSDMELVPTRLS